MEIKLIFALFYYISMLFLYYINILFGIFQMENW